ncbi:hypothetical protein TRFO_29896 [Tritrichomonas foetus]|uniref:Uncharacterized protein n=1 Tax=Tritrichomonas foetus TaxID=1144522 RepID=A0A1J4JUK1_9EUKA|nr:hypothetical protein TRFO_29896 [Tritrichomonas foetus]|eukprot:OHT02831.1 hypothetical protein TRFO_29896 [Tritrichomonas foetus]
MHPQETSQGEALTEKVQYETIQKVQHLWEEYENYLTLIYSIDQRNNEEMRKNQQKEKKIDDIMKNIELFTQSYTSYCQIYERIDNLFDSLNEELGALENYISSNGDISPAFISRVEAASNLLECTSNLRKMLPNPSNHSQS